jgi:hypothetical protein
MDERGANIDLVFRNGLKDFEVLPPPKVWNGIHAVIKTKPRPFIFLKAAALITVLLALSFFIYRSSREMSTEPSSSVMAFNEEASSPFISPPIDGPQNLTTLKHNQVKNSSNVLIESSNPGNIINETEKTSSPEEVIYLQETKSLLLTNSQSVQSPFLASLKTSQGNSFKIKEHDLQYFPENITAKHENRWSIAAMASPTYYSRFNSGSDELSKQLMASEQPLISYSGGVAFSYKISKRFSIQSGLYYSSLGQKVDGVNSFSGFQKYVNSKGGPNFEVPTTNGTIYTNNPDVFLVANGTGEKVLTAYTNDVFDPNKANLQYINNTLIQNFSYLEFPVVLRYKVVDKMIGINLIGGLSYNLLVNNSVYTTIDGNKYPVGDTKILNPLTLSSSLGMGMEYNFSEKLSLNLEPTFRYYLNPFSGTIGSNIHPYSFGIFSGVSYKF